VSPTRQWRRLAADKIRDPPSPGSRVRQPVTLAVALALAGLAPAATAGAADGHALFAACAACHGAHGEGNSAQGTPNIAGLDAAYIERQLRDFSAGRRGGDAKDTYGARMRAAAQALADTQAQRGVADYVAALAPVAAGGVAPKGNSASGRNFFNAICSSCHGSGGLGNAGMSVPRLAGTDPQYLLRQLTAFRAGARGADPADTYGAQMRKMALLLPKPADVQDVIAYVATLAAPAAPGRGTPP
jgi:cytochrome c553